MGVRVLGSINVDVILQVASLPRAGETALAREAIRLPGGKGANQAVAAARMGADTAMLGAVGSDEAGAWMCGVLAEAGVATAGIRRLPGLPTGTAHIAVADDGENQIIVAPGANGAFEAAMIDPVPGDVLLAQLEIPIATIAAAFARAQDCARGPDSPLRILNAAPALPQAAALFEDADILIVNQHELAVYLGCGAVAGPDAALAARDLIARDGQLVVVTLGAGGALAVWPDCAVHVPALPAEPLDTVGAGDCFCGSLAALLDEGFAVEEALPLANAAAALATQHRGAITAMPDRRAAEAFLAGRQQNMRRKSRTQREPI